jgi:hypothetical protein
VVETTMELSSWLRKQVKEASPDLLRAMVQDFAEALMGAEADALCGAGYGERTPERLTYRNGYRTRSWSTRAGDPEAAPRLGTSRASSSPPALGAGAGLAGAGGPLRGVAAGTVARERIEDRRDDLFRRGTDGHDRAAVEQMTERERF